MTDSQRKHVFISEELVLAVEKLRKRLFSTRQWFIPVLLSKCIVPDRDIGAGKRLKDLNWVLLYEQWDKGIQRIIEVIRPISLEIQNYIRALSLPNPDIRVNAANTLGKIGDPSAVPALTAALRDDTPWVHDIAASALDKIGVKF